MKRRDLIKVIERIDREKGLVPEFSEGGNHTKVRLGM